MSETMEEGPARIPLDSRRPHRLDSRTDALRVVAGHVEVFAMETAPGGAAGARHHLFRVETGGVLLGFPGPDAEEAGGVAILAVGGSDAQAVPEPRGGIDGPALAQWIGHLAGAIVGRYPAWDIREAGTGRDVLAPGERRRGAARGLVWASVARGSARLMGVGPDYAQDGPAVPLTSGMWIEAGEGGCTLAGDRAPPSGSALAAALDAFDACALGCIRGRLAEESDRQAARLAQREERAGAETLALFDSLSRVIARRNAATPTVSAGLEDPLFSACAIVAGAGHARLSRPSSFGEEADDISSVFDIARASRLRVRQTVLSGEWWRWDGGPLLAWLGEERNPVALLPEGRRGYVMVDPAAGGRRRRVTAALAAELSPLAATFYPPLPARPLRMRDLLAFALRHSRGSYGRLVLSVAFIGLLSLVTPLITQAIVTSVIPRTELDQLAYCALALVVTTVAATGVQLLEMTALLRIEGLIDWKLQAAVIDRMLRLPASVFRAFTVGDFVDRALGIEAIRRIFTGQTLRSLMSGVFAWFSIALMVYYDGKLALVALALILFRAAVTIATCTLRLYYEARHITLDGKVSGLVLQLLAGVGKLRVANATMRGLAVWGEQFATAKRQFITSRRIANALTVFDGSFGVIATLAIFSAALYLQSSLTRDLGAFLGFFAAFGQAMGSIGSWATAVSDSLAVIPRLTRMKPLLTGAVEISEDRKPPGPLSGAIELSRLTFRYAEAGPPILDNLTLRIEPGEYVALVGPSGSGKSSLLRLLLGFEKAESGAIFYDGKAIDTLDIGALRRQFGVVLQNGKLSNGSIYDNICGGAQLSLEQAWEAARLASLDEDIQAMPMGMHTVISEGVSTISGGQRQRIMIARAISRRPRIILLDEATSSLDNRSQAVVSAALGNLAVTRIVIAHRLSTVREADRIVVLVDGKIVQSGPFDVLSGQPGVFADLAQRQLL